MRSSLTDGPLSQRQGRNELTVQQQGTTSRVALLVVHLVTMATVGCGVERTEGLWGRLRDGRMPNPGLRRGHSPGPDDINLRHTLIGCRVITMTGRRLGGQREGGRRGMWWNVFVIKCQSLFGAPCSVSIRDTHHTVI